MTKRFVLEGERPSGWLADSYIAVGFILPPLFVALVWMIIAHARPSAIALVFAVCGIVVSIGMYLADLQFQVTVVLGDDGLLVYGNRRTSIFVSHGAIVGVCARDGFLEIERSDGSPLVFRARPKLPLRTRENRAQEIMAAIDDAHDWYRAHEKQRVDEPLFHRSGRRGLELVRDLKSLTQATVETYRSAPFDRDRLWRLAENPSATAYDRIAAFIALRVDAEEPVIQRLRNSLEQVADETTAARLRVAMRSTSDEELAGLLDLNDEEEDAPLSLPQRIRRRRAI